MSHIYFDSDSINWEPYMRQQQIGGSEYTMMGGRDMNESEIFRGLKYMRGYGIKSSLSSAGRFLLPIAKNLMETAKKDVIAPTVVGTLAEGLFGDRPFGEAFKKYGSEGLERFGKKIQQCGKGKKRKTKKKQIAMGTEPTTSYAGTAGTEQPVPKKMRKKDYLDV